MPSNGLAPMEQLLVELHAYQRRLAGNHKSLGLAIHVAQTIAQNQSHAVGPIFQIRGRKKASLPRILVC